MQHDYAIGGVMSRGSLTAAARSSSHSVRRVPVAPATGLSATSANGNVTLTWTAAASQLPITAYKVYRNGTFVGESRIHGPTAVGSGVPVRIGKTIIELYK